MNYRKTADKILEALEVEPVHVSGPVTRAHGHGGLCCCMMQQCRETICDVNKVLVVLVEAES